MSIVLPASVAFLAAWGLAPLVRRLAFAVGAVDRPDGARKIHRRPTAELGGLVILAAVVAGVAIAFWLGGLPGAHIREKHLVGLVVGLVVLALGGAVDDRFDLRPWQQFTLVVLAALVVIAAGIGITFVTSPLGGQLRLDGWQFILFWFRGIPYKVTVIADLFTLAWLLVMTHTTKLADGLDGLVSGLAVIGAGIITAVSFMKDVAQPDTAVLALVVAGAFAGFLIHNFNPASIFLGQGGSTMAGFLLGALAIVSGGKIATALLVLGLPLFDAALVVVRRVIAGRSPFAADRSHLHHRLLDAGLTQRQAVLFYWFTAALFGVSTLMLDGLEKLVAIGLLASVVIAGTAGYVAWRRRA
jgi:UDP-GlcNAc:undecaprenyl-phosphate GlcNAc-1-phosphate transferase